MIISPYEIGFFIFVALCVSAFIAILIYLRDEYFRHKELSCEGCLYQSLLWDDSPCDGCCEARSNFAHK